MQKKVRKKVKPIRFYRHLKSWPQIIFPLFWLYPSGYSSSLWIKRLLFNIFRPKKGLNLDQIWYFGQINTFLGRFFGFCKKQRVLHGSLDIPDDSSVYFETLKESFSLPDTHFGRNLAKIWYFGKINAIIGRWFGFCIDLNISSDSLDIPDDISLSFKTI